MGSIYVEGLKDSGMDMRRAVSVHLQCNHYPPVPQEMVDPAIEAINNCNEGDYEKRVETPFEHRSYGSSVPSRIIVEQLHLDPWIDWEVF